SDLYHTRAGPEPLVGIGSDSELPMTRFILGVLVFFLGGHPSLQDTKSGSVQTSGGAHMRLGNFSVSLAVKDLGASRAFYEKLGFRAIASFGKNVVILQNETSTIGLFQGMFDKNILTFNPGWDRTGATLPDYDDVRDIQRMLTSRGLALTL